jgi:hypothetical protein
MVPAQMIDFATASHKVMAKRMSVVTPMGYMVMGMTMGVYFTQAIVTCYTNVLRSSLQQPLKYE